MVSFGTNKQHRRSCHAPWYLASASTSVRYSSMCSARGPLVFRDRTEGKSIVYLCADSQVSALTRSTPHVTIVPGSGSQVSRFTMPLPSQSTGNFVFLARLHRWCPGRPVVGHGWPQPCRFQSTTCQVAVCLDHSSAPLELCELFFGIILAC